MASLLQFWTVSPYLQGVNPSAPIQARALPFDREAPGAWQKWEEFWVDFLNAEPLLPWPGKPFRFKRSVAAEKWGLAGGSQDGIDMRAEMEDGTVLAVQCKNWKAVDPTKAMKAMDKAEREFPSAQAYFLVFTEKEISAEIQKDADRRGNWKAIGRDTLSSWFFSGKFLDVEAQKRLIDRHFGHDQLKALFPQPWDELLIPSSQFFAAKNLIPHEAELQGKEFQDLVETLANALGEGRPRISILSAAGGQGKTRLLKATAEFVESRFPDRKVLFLNDDAGVHADDYGLRGAEFINLGLLIDDAHRLENVRKRLLTKVQESGSGSILIAARPNNIRALESRLEECGFVEGDWKKHQVPILDYAGRRALAVEILGSDDASTLDFLAKESERCPLVCTIGAQLILAGGVAVDVLKTEHFRRKVFDQLMGSSLDHMFVEDPDYRKISELCLRSMALLSPVQRKDDLPEYLAGLVDSKVFDVDPIISKLREAGLLRSSWDGLRVAPDLLSDHLAYDTAYGVGRNPALVRNLIKTADPMGFAMIFANLSEAEWRARQEGEKDTFLDKMWVSFREILNDPADNRILGLMNRWREIAIFQPERTLEMAEIILDHEAMRIREGSPEVMQQGYRYDAISMCLRKLPDLLDTVAKCHPEHRDAALDLLWQIGVIKGGKLTQQDDFPAAWQAIARTGSLANWYSGGPQDVFDWLKVWAARGGKYLLEDGHAFLSRIAVQWFENGRNQRWQVAEAKRAIDAEIGRFRNEVLTWLDEEVIAGGLGASWACLPVIFAAGDQILLRKILTQHDDPLIRLSIWQYLSKRVANEDHEERKLEWLDLRDSIHQDLRFQLVRLASSYAMQEWNHERLEKWGKDYDACSNWWAELASKTVEELRRKYPSIKECMQEVNRTNGSLVKFKRRVAWDMVAEAWSANFPHESSQVLDELMENPDHALVHCLGNFLGLSDEMDSEVAEKHTLAALSHADDRVRRAVLRRLSWKDVPRLEPIAEMLRSMASSTDSVVVAAMAAFISWNQYEATPYFDEVLAALNMKELSSPDLAAVAVAVTQLMEYAKPALSADLLASYFKRLEQEEDLDKVFHDHLLSVFHDKFPLEMFGVYLNRIRSGKFSLWVLDDWFLPGLPEHLGHPAFEKLARDLFHETIQADSDHFYNFRQLFDASVARVNPRFTAKLLSKELGKSLRQHSALERVVELTGAGHGSVVYEAPEFTKELLAAIDSLPKKEAKELRGRMIWSALPHMWGASGEGIDKEYLWAKDKAAPLAEQYRSDPVLRNFYLEIVHMQEDEDARTRRRFRHDD